MLKARIGASVAAAAGDAVGGVVQDFGEDLGVAVPLISLTMPN